ncbi:uncharacterized protein [Drosophila takahashii]|uniref:uncharacterized protein n=1 Tax=Drosophila takahashii TaxID=29030 RepID=UPI0038991E23
MSSRDPRSPVRGTMADDDYDVITNQMDEALQLSMRDLLTDPLWEPDDFIQEAEATGLSIDDVLDLCVPIGEHLGSASDMDVEPDGRFGNYRNPTPPRPSDVVMSVIGELSHDTVLATTGKLPSAAVLATTGELPCAAVLATTGEMASVAVWPTPAEMPTLPPRYEDISSADESDTMARSAATTNRNTASRAQSSLTTPIEVIELTDSDDYRPPLGRETQPRQVTPPPSYHKLYGPGPYDSPRTMARKQLQSSGIVVPRVEGATTNEPLFNGPRTSS